MRGFGFQELGPRDLNNVPLGGRSLAEFALEGRYRFGNYGVVAFVDAGQVYESAISDLLVDALRRRRRRAGLHQFRAGPGRRRDPDRPPRRANR